MAIAIAGLTSDARVLRYLIFLKNFSNYMRNECMHSKMIYNRPLPISRIVDSLADSNFNISLSIIKRHKLILKIMEEDHMVLVFLL